MRSGWIAFAYRLRDVAAQSPVGRIRRRGQRTSRLTVSIDLFIATSQEVPQILEQKDQVQWVGWRWLECELFIPCASAAVGGMHNHRADADRIAGM
jgi:hypothetical protein